MKAAIALSMQPPSPAPAPAPAPAAAAGPSDELRLARAAMARQFERQQGAASSSARRKFENGDTVTVHGLVAAPQFNGKRGYVDGFNAESGRYTISLFEPVGDRCELLVKEINLSK